MLAFAAWWFISEYAQSLYFPPLREILVELWDKWITGPYLAADVWPSLQRLVAGFVLACLIGVALGAVIGLNEHASRVLNPVLEFMRALPPIALLPIAIVVLGIGDGMKIDLIALGAVWPVLLNTVMGVRGVPQERLDMGRSFSLRQDQVLWRIILPSALPQIFSGMRVSISIAIVVMVVSEMVASVNGIGYQTLHAARLFDLTTMWSGMIVLSVVGVVLNITFARTEQYYLGWAQLPVDAP